MSTRTSWAVAAVLALAAPAGAQDFQWHGRVPAGKTLTIRGVYGAIDASAASGDEVEVSATKHGRRSDPASVRVEVVEEGDGVTICAVYPDVDGRRNECRASGGHNNTRDNDVEVHFTVRVPRGVGFRPETVNGDVQAADLEGDVEAETVNGSIQVSTTGRVQAETVNGSIRASGGRADWSGEAAFKTVNGSITLTLPSSTAVNIRAETVNGTIETDFPLTMTGGIKMNGGQMRRLSGTIGGGGPNLEMETVNGSIHLRKSS
jgi:hypothetical protein